MAGPNTEIEYRIYGNDDRGYYVRVVDTIDELRHVVKDIAYGEIEQIVKVVTTKTTVNHPGPNVCDELED